MTRTFGDHPFLGVQIDMGPRDQGIYCGSVNVVLSPLPVDTLYPLVPGGELPEPSVPVSTMAFKTFTTAQGTVCSDFDLVEELAIRHMIANSPTMPKPGDVHEIRRAMMAIAKATRRGAGNVMLMHPSTAYQFRASVMINAFQYGVFKPPTGDIEERHGWRLFHTGNAGMVPATWVKRTVPPGIALVVYRGAPMDCGYLAIGHWSRPHFVVNDFGNVPGHAYARLVKF